MKIDGEKRLVSRISAALAYPVTLAEVNERLAFYPGLVQLSGGPVLTYALSRANRIECEYTLEISEGEIAMAIYSKISPHYFVKDALARLLGVAAALSGVCEIRLESIYPYLMEALAGESIAHYEAKVNSQHRCSKNDIILSKRILSLLRENARLSVISNSREKKLIRMAAECITVKYPRGSGMNAVARELGLEVSEVSKALACVEELGYKAIIEGEKFEVVKE